MKAGIEIYIGLILLTISGLLCANFISADIGIMNARNAHSTYITEIEDSDFSPTVIAECKSDASSNGYTLEVSDSDLIGRTEVKYVTLTYTYEVPILGVRNEHKIYGCAR